MVLPPPRFLSDHYVQVLSCKQNCVTELASHPGREKPFEDFLPSHYDYLQFAYYNSKASLLFLSCFSLSQKQGRQALWPLCFFRLLGFSLGLWQEPCQVTPEYLVTSHLPRSGTSSLRSWGRETLGPHPLVPSITFIISFCT